MVEHAQPAVVVLENVKGFLSVGGGNYFKWLRARLKTIGYRRIQYKVLGTQKFALPQKRERLYMVAVRDDIEVVGQFRFPLGDEAHTPSLSKFLKRRLAKRYANTIRVGGRGSKDRHAWDMVKRANAGWYQLTVSDCKALMGFPKDFDMPVPRTHQFRLLGNAITIEPGRSILTECKRVVEEAYRRSKRQKV